MTSQVGSWAESSPIASSRDQWRSNIVLSLIFSLFLNFTQVKELQLSRLPFFLRRDNHPELGTLEVFPRGMKVMSSVLIEFITISSMSVVMRDLKLKGRIDGDVINEAMNLTMLTM